MWVHYVDNSSQAVGHECRLCEQLCVWVLMEAADMAVCVGTDAGSVNDCVYGY